MPPRARVPKLDDDCTDDILAAMLDKKKAAAATALMKRPAAAKAKGSKKRPVPVAPVPVAAAASSPTPKKAKKAGDTIILEAYTKMEQTREQVVVRCACVLSKWEGTINKRMPCPPPLPRHPTIAMAIASKSTLHLA